MKVDQIVEKFESYCKPRKNVTFAQHSFFAKELTGVRLRTSSVNNDTVRAGLLRESELSLKTCIDIY